MIRILLPVGYLSSYICRFTLSVEDGSPQALSSLAAFDDLNAFEVIVEISGVQT